MSGPELALKILEAGVVGAGGAGFPTHIKLKSKADIVIANGAECEPLIQVDQQLLISRPVAVLRALQAVKEAVGAQEAYLALKFKHEQAVTVLREEIARGYEDITLKSLPDIYPAGDEQVLVYEVTQRVVPEGGIPLQVGVIVLNIETLLNIYAALNGQPVINKYVTVNGAVAKPVTVKVPVGTPVLDLLALAGGPMTKDFLLLDGGPMMGKAVNPEYSVVTKTTKGLLVLPVDHPLALKKLETTALTLKRSLAACCQCRECTDLCPRYLLGHRLEPHRTIRAAAYRIGGDALGISGALLCSECGLCELFACTLGLNPRQVNVAVKQEWRRQGFRFPTNLTQPQVNTWRRGRLVPTSRLISRLGLSAYDRKAPLSLQSYQPRLVRLPLRQSAGQASEPLVQVGDKVVRGQLIGVVPQDKVGAYLHASIDGVVLEVSEAIQIRGEGVASR